MARRWQSSLVVAVCAAISNSLAQAPAYPDTPRKAVTDTYHGVQVVDEYRWLEDGKDPAVRAWTQAQLEVTRAALDGPAREAVRGRLKELMGSAAFRYSQFHETRDGLFALKMQPPKNQPMLVVMKSPLDPSAERVLLDLNTLDPSGKTAIDFFAPSVDGRFVAVVLSEKGSEDGAAHVIEVATGKRRADIVPRVQYPTGGGSIAWHPNGSGFFYTRYPQGDERPAGDAHFYQQVYFHRLGTPARTDRYEIGREFPRIAETKLETSRESGHVLASVANGDGGEHAFYIREPAGGWTKIADFADGIKGMEMGHDGRLYALSYKDAPRGKVLVLSRTKPDLSTARVILAEGEDTIEAIHVSRNRIFATYMAGGPSEVRIFDLQGRARGRIPTEPVSNVGIGTLVDARDVLVSVQSFVSAPAWFLYSGNTGEMRKVALAGESPVKFDDAEVVRELATSKDGTRVPVNILMKKGTKRDGSNPTLLYVYGAYGLSMRPFFNVQNREWLDRGGIYVLANVRGGGEFGEAWHLAGNLTRKQNVFDDAIAAAQHLVDRGYTRPDRLAAMGGSNGGLVMGAILTQRPDLFRAIVASVGIYDMLRVELTPNGAFNVTEFGTVRDPQQFKAILAYSPFHHVKAGTTYPAVLLISGENDGRVDPYNSRKMAAVLQASGSKNRVLLRMNPSTGHGQGTALSERIEQAADVYAFLYRELGIE